MFVIYIYIILIWVERERREVICSEEMSGGDFEMKMWTLPFDGVARGRQGDGAVNARYYSPDTVDDGWPTQTRSNPANIFIFI